MKGFEEQLKKQDSRIQSILEANAVERLALEEKLATNYSDMKALLEANSAEMKIFMVSMSAQYTAFVRSLQGDKGILGTLPDNTERHPVQRPRRNLELGQSSQGERNYLPVGSSKVKFPNFDGSNPKEWVRKCEKFFS